MRLRPLGLALLAFGVAQGASADGEYLQFDFAPSASSAVASIQRGEHGIALGWSEWDEGSAATAFLSRSVPLGGGFVLKAGPSLRWEDRPGEGEAGLRLALERWTPAEWGGIFTLADVNSIRAEYLLLAETSHAGTGLSAALTVQGDNADYRETTATLGYRLGESPVRLRLGHCFVSGDTFVGFSINTF